jgi:hypothetical protein
MSINTNTIHYCQKSDAVRDRKDSADSVITASSLTIGVYQSAARVRPAHLPTTIKGGNLSGNSRFKLATNN